MVLHRKKKAVLENNTMAPEPADESRVEKRTVVQIPERALT